VDERIHQRCSVADLARIPERVGPLALNNPSRMIAVGAERESDRQGTLTTQTAVVLQLGSCCIVNGNHPAVQISPVGRLPLEWKPVVTRAGVIPFKPSHPFPFIEPLARALMRRTEKGKSLWRRHREGPGGPAGAPVGLPQRRQRQVLPGRPH
jgi:hypothetical protein